MSRDYQENDTMKLVGKQNISIIRDNPEIKKGLDDIVNDHLTGIFSNDLTWLAFNAILYGYVMGKRAEKAERRQKQQRKSERQHE